MNNSFPLTYNLYFNININNNNYNGSNSIILNVVNKTNIIQFNGKNLNITEIKLNNIIIPINDISFDKQNDLYTVKCNCEPNIYTLDISFIGIMGPYEGLVKNDSCIYTRFEPIQARQCYPCWDEPKYKVKYNTKIQINDPSYVVLYNTDPISINNMLYTFAETIPMSSYLSAFIISKFNYIEIFTKHNIRLRVYIPIDKQKETGQFALDCGKKMIDFAVNYFNISFPYNKIDFVSIYDTTVSGMENYGLIFYKSDCLLFDKYTSTINDYIAIAHVIAHELAHQWFGNLISINEWNNLWLKESFAKFFEYFIVDAVFPEWDCYSMFTINILKTFDYDFLSYKTIKIKKVKHTTLDEIYNKLTYYKGGLLLNILLKYIGYEKFKTNISNYLINNKHSVIDNNIFIKAISTDLDTDKQNKIKLLINDYNNNIGFPIININNNNNINIKSFDYVNIINNQINNKKIDLDNINRQILIKDDNDFVICNNNYNVKNIITNNKKYCYYRMCYTEEQFNYLLNNINNETSKQHISIYSDLYNLGIFNICPINYWLIYTEKLINLLLSYNNKNQFNYYLIYLIYDDIKLIKDISSNNRLVGLFDILINKLNILFDIFNINTYIKQNLVSNNMNYNLLVFFLLSIKSEYSTKLLYYMFDNKLFNLYGDLNYIIIKRIIINDDVLRINKFKSISKEFPFMFDIIKYSLIYSKNKKLINDIFKYQILNMDFNYISDLLSVNEYFVNLFTQYIFNNQHLLKTDDIRFIDLINELLGNQTNYDTILKLLNILKQTNINISVSKNKLFKNLYIKYFLSKTFLTIIL